MREATGRLLSRYVRYFWQIMLAETLLHPDSWWRNIIAVSFAVVFMYVCDILITRPDGSTHQSGR